MFKESKKDFFSGDDQGLDEKIVYVPKNGVAIEIDAIVNEEFPEQEEYLRSLEFAFAEIDVHNSDVKNPRDGDTYTFHGYTWNHKSAKKTGDFWTVLVVREPS